MKKLAHAKHVINLISQKTDRVLLFYSCGKDSIALLDLLSKEFDEVVCVFMYFVRELSHTNRFIRFSEIKYPNVTFHQVPHWNLTYLHRAGLYCKPNPNIRLLKLMDVNEAMRLKTGINYSFFGMKQADGMHRRIMLKGYEEEAINYKTNNVYPLSTWYDKDVLRYIKENKLPQPVQYGNKRSNGVGFDIDVFLYLQKNYPNDLKKIFDEYPLAERILFEHEQTRVK